MWGLLDANAACWGCQPHPCPRVPVSPPSFPPRGGPGPLRDVPIPAGISSTSRLSHPQQTGSFPAAGPARPLPAVPGDGMGPGRRDKGLLLLQPHPEPPGTSPEPTVPARCPGASPSLRWWHRATKGRDAQDRRPNSPQPGDFGDLQGVFSHKERAVTFYSSSGKEYQLCEPHQGSFQWDGAGEVTTTPCCCGP